MQNKTPIVVLTGLGIVAAAAVAGLTRDQWMGHKAEVVATAPSPEAPKTPEQPAATAETPAPAPAPAPQPPAQPPAEQPATTTTTTAATASSQPAAQAPAAETSQQAAPAAPASQAQDSQQAAAAQPETQPGQPAAGNAGGMAKVPAFDTVRVEKTGAAVIAGTAAPNADVVVKFDGKVIGQTTANGDGAFVLVPEAPLPIGSGALTLEAKAKDAAQATPSQQSVAVIVPAADQPQEALVAVVSPDQPTRVLQKPEAKQDKQPAAAAPAQPAPTPEKPAKLVSIDAVDYDANGNIVFSGQGDEGNTARIYIDNNFLGDAPVGPDGRWTFSGTAQVAPGVHTLRVDGLDGEGKVVNRVEVPFVREEQKKVAEVTQPAQTTQPAAQTTQPAAQTTQPAEQTTQPAAQTTQPAEQTTQPAEQTTQPETTTTTTTSGATEQPAAVSPAKPKDGRIVIQPGNNLWRISRVLYGTGAKFTTLYEANKDQIRDPDRIYPGQVFKTPDVAPTSESIDPKRRDPLKPEENAAPAQ